MSKERLHKFLAHGGVASRRKAEALIAEGRVAVNGAVVTQMGVKIDPARDRVEVDGESVRPERKVYLLLHKPRGATTTVSDEQGRRTVLDVAGEIPERVYPVGRLDRDSEGLLVLTNDGELAQVLTHPSYEVKKIYEATVEGDVPDETIERIRQKGVRVGGALIRPMHIRVLRRTRTGTVVRVVVAEGINREVRRLFAALGHEVRRLFRTAVGPFTIDGLSRGRVRRFTREELREARALAKRAGEEPEAPPSPDRRRPRPRTTAFGEAGRPGKPDPARSPASGRGGKKGKKRSKESGKPSPSGGAPNAAGSPKKKGGRKKPPPHPLAGS